MLEGGIEGRPEHVIFYATSNRRHLMPREMLENERSTAINPSEGVDETVSLSDRFGLWIGFHNCSQDDYLDMVRGYAAHYRLPIEDEALTREALAWAIGRGARSGRVAFQYIQDVAGRLGVRLDERKPTLILRRPRNAAVSKASTTPWSCFETRPSGAPQHEV